MTVRPFPTYVIFLSSPLFSLIALDGIQSSPPIGISGVLVRNMRG